MVANPTPFGIFVASKVMTCIHALQDECPYMDCRSFSLEWPVSCAVVCMCGAVNQCHYMGCRRFLLEWLSFLCRYVPVGLLEVVPQQLHWRPPVFCGRSDLETLLSSQRPSDWVAVSEMLLGPPPPGFVFTPKHKSNSYTATESSMSFEDQENG